MSHFTVGVILNKEKVDKKAKSLIDDYRNSIGFEPVEEEEEIKALKFKAIQSATQEALSPFDENAELEPYINVTIEKVKAKHEEIKNYTEADFGENGDNYNKYLHDKYKDSDLRTFAENYYGGVLTNEGIEVTWNSNAKWDWYVIGGRWAGCLKKKGQEELDKSISTYDDDENSYAKINEIEFKEEISEEKREKLQSQYRNLIAEGDFYKPEYYLRKYPTYEAYEEDSTSFNTYALLTSDGEWHEPGEMGWFGCSSAKPEDEARFKTNYNELIAKENPENYFVLVDCHI